MTEMLQANVFFFIASASFVAFTIFLCIAVFYLITILRAISRITKRIEEGSETVTDDLKQLKHYVIGGTAISHIVGLFVKSKRKRASRQQEED